MNHPYLQQTLDSLTLTPQAMRTLARAFRAELEAGLAGEASSLKMLPSFLGKPSGQESGDYLTVDMGGSNLRCTRYRLSGGQASTLQEQKYPLSDPQAGYDLICAQADADTLFDFIAGSLSGLLAPGESLPLGNTFSFPCRQEGVNEAYLIYWTKEIATRGVEGENINALLSRALARRGVAARPVAILNDTVGTLLVALYRYPQADIGSIMGTGHNTCYLEYRHPLGGAMIVNLESGNFNVGLPQTVYDRAIDAESSLPGTQLLEKMVAGRYIGDLVRRILADLCEHGALFADAPEQARAVLREKLSALTVERIILEPDFACELFGCGREQALLAGEVAKAVLRRNVRLIAATYLGILFHQEAGEELRQQHVIAIDGTIYEKMPGVPDMLAEALRDTLGEAAGLVECRLVKDGSGLGAAVAAALADRA